MMKKVLSLLLSGTLALSLLPFALAADAAPAHGETTVNEAAVQDPAGTVSFGNLHARMQSGNLSIQFCLETLASVNAMDRETAYKDLQDQINALNDAAWAMTSQSSSLIQKALAPFDEATLSTNEAALRAALSAVGEAAAVKAYYQVQANSLKSARDSLEDQLDNLKKENYEKTLSDTTHQINASIHQLYAAGDSLYLSILSINLQLDSLRQTLAGTERTLQETALRYQLGQVSRLTLTQTQNAYDTLVSSISKLERSISTMKVSLQSMLGEPAGGNLSLTEVPAVTPTDLAALSYDDDLKTALKNSYTVYSADRALSDAKDDWTDAQKDYGTSSYKYAMAQHTYQAAVYTHNAALENFSVSFHSLYQAIPTARQALAEAESALAYQQQCYKIARLKYQLGSLSYHALLTAKDSVDAATRDVSSAQLNLFSAYHTYRMSMDYGLVSTSGA